MCVCGVYCVAVLWLEDSLEWGLFLWCRCGLLSACGCRLDCLGLSQCLEAKAFVSGGGRGGEGSEEVSGCVLLPT